MLMVLLSLLPVGLLQTKRSVEVGYWYARSPEFMQPLLNNLRWMRPATRCSAGPSPSSTFAASLLLPSSRPAAQVAQAD